MAQENTYIGYLISSVNKTTKRKASLTDTAKNYSSLEMCFEKKPAIRDGFSAQEEIEIIAEKKNYCTFCKKLFVGPRIMLVVHLAMVHTERSLFECSNLLTTYDTARFIQARKRRIAVLHSVPH